MDINAVKELLKNTSEMRSKIEENYQQSMRYYLNQNDITNRTNGKSEKNKDGKDEPLHRADNRVSSNFHQLLVDQEAAYVATDEPDIDLGNQADNKRIKDVLGDDFNLVNNRLVIDAANSGLAWLHYWIDTDGNFRYGVIPPDQVMPIWSTELDSKLLGVLRSYKQLDSDSGKFFTVHEYWNDKECLFYRTKIDNPNELEPYNRITSIDLTAGYETGQGNSYEHGLGRVPFIAFPKNKFQQPDLQKYKGLIDAYDDIYNGFLNDIDDVQQVILVLTNYGGASLDKFMSDLKKYKSIKIQNNGAGDNSGVDKLQIDIPVEARNTVLNITRDDIFLHGQGVDPSKFDSTNASGVAIKMLYSHLELKAANTEAQFRRSINELIRAIMNYLKFKDADNRKITQTWTRTSIKDDLAEAQTLAQVANWSSKEAIARNNPLVDDWQQELKDQKKDIQDSDGYSQDDDHANPDKLNGGSDDHTDD